MKNSRGFLTLLVVAALPCLLCSGMATVIVGQEFGAKVLGIILLVYLVIACIGLVTWLVVGRGHSRQDSQAADREEGDGREPDAGADGPRD